MDDKDEKINTKQYSVSPVLVSIMSQAAKDMELTARYVAEANKFINSIIPG